MDSPTRIPKWGPVVMSDSTGQASGSQEESLAESMVDGTQIKWRDLFGLLASGIFLWMAGLLSSFISGMYRLLAYGVSWAIESMFTVWEAIPNSQTWIVERSFEIAGSSIESEFGVMAFLVGVVLLIVWFVAIESIVAFFRGWWG